MKIALFATLITFVIVSFIKSEGWVRYRAARCEAEIYKEALHDAKLALAGVEAGVFSEADTPRKIKQIREMISHILALWTEPKP